MLNSLEPVLELISGTAEPSDGHEPDRWPAAPAPPSPNDPPATDETRCGFSFRTMVPLSETLCRLSLSGTQRRVLDVILRYSLGWQRSHCDKLTKRGIGRILGRKTWGQDLDEAMRGLAGIGVIHAESTTRGAPSSISLVVDSCRWDGGCDAHASTTGDAVLRPKWCLRNPESDAVELEKWCSRQHTTRTSTSSRTTSRTTRDRAPSEDGARRSKMKAWCGTCDEVTRHVRVDDHTSGRCQACHPLREPPPSEATGD